MRRIKTHTLILQLYTRTPAPCRDYCGLTIETNEIVLNIWNVTFGPHVYPKRYRRSIEDFDSDKYLQLEISRLFGEHVFRFITSISKNEKRLENLPSRLFLKILNNLAARDIVNLSQTSKILFDLCNTENVWKMLYRKYFKRRPATDTLINAEKFGWKQILMQKAQHTSELRSKGRDVLIKNRQTKKHETHNQTKKNDTHNQTKKKETHKSNNVNSRVWENSSKNTDIRNLMQPVQSKIKIQEAKRAQMLNELEERLNISTRHNSVTMGKKSNLEDPKYTDGIIEIKKPAVKGFERELQINPNLNNPIDFSALNNDAAESVRSNNTNVKSISNVDYQAKTISEKGLYIRPNRDNSKSTSALKSAGINPGNEPHIKPRFDTAKKSNALNYNQRPETKTNLDFTRNPPSTSAIAPKVFASNEVYLKQKINRAEHAEDFSDLTPNITLEANLKPNPNRLKSCSVLNTSTDKTKIINSKYDLNVKSRLNSTQSSSFLNETRAGPSFVQQPKIMTNTNKLKTASRPNVTTLKNANIKIDVPPEIKNSAAFMLHNGASVKNLLEVMKNKALRDRLPPLENKH